MSKSGGNSILNYFKTIESPKNSRKRGLSPPEADLKEDERCKKTKVDLSVDKKVEKVEKVERMNVRDKERDKERDNDKISYESLEKKCFWSGSVEFVHLSLKFLRGSEIRDGKGRSPEDVEYDGTTLTVPESFLANQTPAQRQWWELKSQHFDKLLFFKMGKFYECFHMDAVDVVKHCGIQFMKKDYAHCGFPEVSFHRFADILISNNFRIARIEQTETPLSMEARCKSSTKKITKFDKVIRREICQVYSIGTQITESSSRDYNYMVALIIRDSRVGICFVDTTVGVIHLGEFEDDGQELARTQLNLYHLNPVEILLDNVSVNNSKGLLKMLNSRFPGVRRSFIKSLNEFPSSKTILDTIIEKKYYNHFDSWPLVLKSYVTLGKDDTPIPSDGSDLILRAFGAVLYYLSEAMIDHGILVQGKVEKFTLIDETCPDFSTKNLILDDSSIFNLDILSKTKKCKSLFGVLDSTVTPFGNRLLKKWVCRPLFLPSDIRERQEAVMELSGKADIPENCIDDLRTSIKSLPDLERLMGIIAANGIAYPSEHPENRAVYFDGGLMSKKKIRLFINCLQGFNSAHDTLKKISKKYNFKSAILHKMMHLDYETQEIDTILKYYDESLDNEKALKEGKILPCKGVDTQYDQIVMEKLSIENDSSNYIKQVGKDLGSRNVKFTGTGKNAFQIEIPTSSCTELPAAFEYTSRRKGFNRYVTKESKEFLDRLAKVSEKESEVLKSVSTRIFHKFSTHFDAWQKIVNTISVLDALLSLARYSFFSIDGTFPTILPTDKSKTPSLKYEKGYHPIIHQVGNGNYIPNDLDMDAPLFILTGANMGGKSTFMRQTALLAILAQIGCKVPARSMTITPIDRIFTRIGASDNILCGESTFMVELLETSKILRSMTFWSLIIVDELGRGTTTYDGMSLASSTVNYLSQTGNRVLFSTHFHRITDNFYSDKKISLYHMAFVMERENELTFLYKLAQGSCSKSHGFNTARLAGLSDDIISKGSKASAKYERKEKVVDSLLKFIGEVLNI
ncbi:DNA mismatch repair protein Msh6 [Lepeophtheirus salmonis]|uniref:DNA mismatch repair protein Msh6 n=1 Tax=Lepeophtheirus salmonis TaxID=72036 RepID=UPI001AE72907|nr:DNA mismatch repair protein Msh6-like [Lepeophtheirus salmonis]